MLEERKFYYDPQMDARSAQRSRSGKLSYWSIRYGAVIVSCLFIIWYCKYYRIPSVSDESSWDFLLFTHSYPLTSCTNLWIESEHRHKYCHFVEDPHAWTIHGIWPSKKNAEGPKFCHPNMKFNETALQSILPWLQEQWPSAKAKDATQFWSHEWEKHGTCAIDDETFIDSEFTYFKLALDWHGLYNITKILNVAGIMPNNETTYTRQQFRDAIKSVWGKAPYFNCYDNKELGVFLINEISLCFSKQLKLLDCDNWYPMDLSNCPAEGITYLDNLPFRSL